MTLNKIKAGETAVVFKTKGDIGPGVRRAARRLGGLKTPLLAVAAAGAAMGTAIAAGMAASTAAFARAGNELNKLSKQTGDSVEQLSKMQFAARQLSIDPEDVAGAIEELNIRLGEAVEEGTGPLSEAFQKLGLDAKELADVPLDRRLGKISDALRGLPRAQRGFLADEIFGGDAFKILPLIDQGADGIARLSVEADRLGAVMSSSQASTAAELTDAWNDVKEVVAGLMREVGAGLAPALTDLLKGLIPVMQQVAEQLFPVLQKIIEIAERASQLTVTAAEDVTGRANTTRAAASGSGRRAVSAADRQREFLERLKARRGLNGRLEAEAGAGSVSVGTARAIARRQAENEEAFESLFTQAFSGVRNLQQRSQSNRLADRLARGNSFPGQFGQGLGASANNSASGVVGRLAAAATSAAQAVANGERRLGETVAGISDRLRDSMNMQSSAASAVNAAAAARLGNAGASVEQRQLETQLRAERLQQQLVDLVRQNRIVWGA